MSVKYVKDISTLTTGYRNKVGRHNCAIMISEEIFDNFSR
jgi:hypothetical protein